MLRSVACCLPAGVDAKALLVENWLADAAAAAATDATPAVVAPPPSTFNPRDPVFNQLPARLSQSAPMRRIQQLTRTAAELERALHGKELAADAREARRAELEEVQGELADAQAALGDLQESFEGDPLALAPWMSALFDAADAGCRLFDAGSDAWPPPAPPLLELLAPRAPATGGPAALSAWLFRGPERVLGTFKRRYELERGTQDGLRVLTRLALSTTSTSSLSDLPALVEAALDASRLAVLGAEGVAVGRVLDGVLLHCPAATGSSSNDTSDADLRAFTALLLAVSRCVAPPGWSPGAAQDEAAAAPLPAPKAAALGLVRPSPEAITAAVRAGVRLAWVVLPLSVLGADASGPAAAALAARHGIQVLTCAPLGHGLVSEAALGVARPNTAEPAAAAGGALLAGVDHLVAGLDAVDRAGGWPRLQELLAACVQVAGAHSSTSTVSVQAVVLAWLRRQGLTPILPLRWSAAARGADWPAMLGAASGGHSSGSSSAHTPDLSSGNNGSGLQATEAGAIVGSAAGQDGASADGAGNEQQAEEEGHAAAASEAAEGQAQQHSGDTPQALPPQSMPPPTTTKAATAQLELSSAEVERLAKFAGWQLPVAAAV